MEKSRALLYRINVLTYVMGLPTAMSNPFAVFADFVFDRCSGATYLDVQRVKFVNNSIHRFIGFH